MTKKLLSKILHNKKGHPKVENTTFGYPLNIDEQVIALLFSLIENT